MITRKQYLNKEFSFKEYYGQFSSPNVVEAIANAIGKEKLLASTDEHLNDIPMRLWDSLPWYGMRHDVAIANQSCYSQEARDKNVLAVSSSDHTCAVKCAAHKWIEAEFTKVYEENRDD